MNSTTSIEPWFIPFDIFMILCTALAIVFATIFLFTIIGDKTCHTVAMMLTANSCISALITGCNQLGMSIFALENDLKQIEYQDPFCIFRAYLSYVSNALLYYSFLIQSIFRYVIVVYPNRLFFQSIRFQVFIICFAWILAFMHPLAFIFTGDILYNVNNQICQIPVRLSFAMISVSVCIYLAPISMIMLIYYKLIRYVQQMSKRVVPVNVLFRAQRELKMVRRIVSLIIVLVITGFPYELFIVMSFFTSPPTYHYRIAFIFLDVSLAWMMIPLVQSNEPLKASLMKRIRIRSSIAEPSVTGIMEVE